MEIDGDNNQADDYLKFKKLEKQLEHLDVMEEYIKLETRNLEKELLHAQEEVAFTNFIFIILFRSNVFNLFQSSLASFWKLWITIMLLLAQQRVKTLNIFLFLFRFQLLRSCFVDFGSRIVETWMQRGFAQIQQCVG